MVNDAADLFLTPEERAQFLADSALASDVAPRMYAPTPIPIPGPDFQREDVRPPRFATSLQPGHSFLDQLAMAIAQAGPPPIGRRDSRGSQMAQGFVGGLAQGFSRARMAKMLDDQMTQQTLRQAQAERNQRAIAENRARRDALLADAKDLTKRRRDLEAFTAQEEAKSKFREPPKPDKTPEQLRAEAMNRTMGEFDAMRAVGKPIYTPPQPPGGPRIGPYGLTPQQISTMGNITDNVRQDPDVKSFVIVRDNFERIREMAKTNTGVGDLAIIFSYMRVLDPESVVRETEFKNAADAVGKLQKIVTIPKFVLKGDRLTPEGRQWFVRSARELYETKKVQHDRAREYYELQARAAGLDPSLIFRDYSASGGEKPVPEGYEVVDGIRVRKKK